MNALDSPLEAIALRYLSYDALTMIFNNFWTWLAVLTAGAISFFWTMKSPVGKVSPKSDPVCFCNPDSTKMVSPPLQPELLEVESDLTRNPIEGVKATTTAPLAPAVGSTDGVTRGKFMVYYYEERENMCNDDEFEKEYVDGHAELSWVNRWEWERMGEDEMGLYSYQDLTVLNGNVVRLWDNSRRTFGSGIVTLEYELARFKF